MFCTHRIESKMLALRTIVKYDEVRIFWYDAGRTRLPKQIPNEQ